MREGEPVFEGPSEGYASQVVTEIDKNVYSSEVRPSRPSLFQVEYADPTLQETPEAKRFEQIIANLSLIHEYVNALSTSIPEALPPKEQAEEQLNEYIDAFDAIITLVSETEIPPQEIGHETDIHQEHRPEPAPNEENEEVVLLSPEQIDAINLLTTIVDQVETPEASEKKKIVVSDEATLSTLVSPLMVSNLRHDIRLSLTDKLAYSQISLRQINKPSQNTERYYSLLRSLTQKWPTQIDADIEKYLKPFERTSLTIDEIRQAFANVQDDTFIQAGNKINQQIPEIAFAIDPSLPVISFTKSQFDRIAANVISNYLKKVDATYSKAAKEQTPFVMPHMSIEMKREGDELVVNIDDDGFPPFKEETIRQGFIGMKERGETGYNDDPTIPTTGIGNARTAEILETHYSDIGASLRPAAVTYPDGKRVMNPDGTLRGARVQFRMKLSSDISNQ